MSIHESLDRAARLAARADRRTPEDVAADFTHAREVMQRSTATRRTIEAQADIAAAHAAPIGIEIAMQEVDRAAEQALHEISNAPTAYRTEPVPAEVIGLDTALSNAAIADTPAVREMGGPRVSRLTVTLRYLGSEAGALVALLDALGPVNGPGIAEVALTEELLRSLEGRWTDPDTFTANVNGSEVAFRRPARGPVRGETPPLPPDAIVLTGPEAERYRAIAAAARKAQASAVTARADGAALLQLFQAFCAGIAPGEQR